MQRGDFKYAVVLTLARLGVLWNLIEGNLNEGRKILGIWY